MQFPIATIWTKRDFSVNRLLWKITFLPSTASTAVDHCGRCCTFVPWSSVSFLVRKELWVVEGKGEGRAGCCTCLLPWGFWCSDYAVMRLWEWRICFCEGGSSGKCAWAGASPTNYVEGAFILKRELARLSFKARYCLRDLWFWWLPHRPD